MNIALLGYGKMGQAIDAFCQEKTNHEIILTIDESNAELLTVKELQKADVIIEFSKPDAAVKNILLAFEAGTPIVSGTTGWLDHWDQITKTCNQNNSAFFYSSNFSVGVHLFWSMVHQFSRLMNTHEDYVALLEETHHIHKLDAPSGTAITTAQKLITEMKRYNEWQLGETNAGDKLPIIAYRENEVPGTHRLTFANEIDEISLQHKAKSRKGFVIGAVKAAEFLVGKTGVYGMDDLLAIS